MEIGRDRGMMANEHITVSGNIYEKVGNFKHSGSYWQIKILFMRK